MANGFYDAQAGTLLGRTAASWVKILAFYTVYYTFLGFVFWGSVQIGMLRVDTKELKIKDVYKKTVGINRPVIVTRTDQPGVDVWPQNMELKDDSAQEYELGVYDEVYGDSPKTWPNYVLQVERFLLNLCPFDERCHFKEFFGENWAEKIDFIEKSENDATFDNIKNLPENDRRRRVWSVCNKGQDKNNNKSNCGKMMKLNHDKLKARITRISEDPTNKDLLLITKPFFFVAINKVIDFKLQMVEDLDWFKKKVNSPSPAFQHSKQLSQTQFKTLQNEGGALVNCYVYDRSKQPGMCCDWDENNPEVRQTGCSAEDQVNCDNRKEQKADDVMGKDVKIPTYKVNAIYPFIKQSAYAYQGYTEEDSANLKAWTYAKPFAMFQLEATAGNETTAVKLENKNHNRPIRCNVVAKNIEYPYLSDPKLIGNPLLKQSGHGWVDFGFLSKEQEKSN